MPFYRDREVIVIGGGNSALEESIYMNEFCKKVTIVTNLPSFTASTVYLEKLKSRTSIATYLNKTCLQFISDEKGAFEALEMKDNATNTIDRLPADGVFIFIGLIPNTALLKDLLDLDENGYIVTECGTVETSVRGIFAAGDCRRGAIAQLAAATGEGVIASFGVKEYLRSLL